MSINKVYLLVYRLGFVHIYPKASSSSNSSPFVTFDSKTFNWLSLNYYAQRTHFCLVYRLLISMKCFFFVYLFILNILLFSEVRIICLCVILRNPLLTICRRLYVKYVTLTTLNDDLPDVFVLHSVRQLWNVKRKTMSKFTTSHTTYSCDHWGLKVSRRSKLIKRFTYHFVKCL